MIIQKAQNRDNFSNNSNSKGYIMITYLIDRDSAAIIVRRSEMSALPSKLKEALRTLGLAAWKDVEAEFFCGKDEVLVIARPRSPLCSRKSTSALRLRRR